MCIHLIDVCQSMLFDHHVICLISSFVCFKKIHQSMHHFIHSSIGAYLYMPIDCESINVLVLYLHQSNTSTQQEGVHNNQPAHPPIQSLLWQYVLNTTSRISATKPAAIRMKGRLNAAINTGEDSVSCFSEIELCIYFYHIYTSSSYAFTATTIILASM